MKQTNNQTNNQANAGLMQSFMENHLLVAVVALSFWVLGVSTGSVASLLVSGVLAFGRPFFAVMLQSGEEQSGQSAHSASLRTSAACAH